jgi:hypothetical protein
MGGNAQGQGGYGAGMMGGQAQMQGQGQGAYDPAMQGFRSGTAGYVRKRTYAEALLQ